MLDDPKLDDPKLDDPKYTAFLHSWRVQPAFALHPSYSTRTRRFRGLEVCWGPSTRYFLPLPPSPPVCPTPMTLAPPSWSTLPVSHPGVFQSIVTYIAGPTPLACDFSKNQEEVWGGGVPMPTLNKCRPLRRVCSAWQWGCRRWEADAHRECMAGRWRDLHSVLCSSSSTTPSLGSSRRVVVWGASALINELLTASQGALTGKTFSAHVAWEDPCVALWLLNPDAPPPTSLEGAISGWRERNKDLGKGGSSSSSSSIGLEGKENKGTGGCYPPPPLPSHHRQQQQQPPSPPLGALWDESTPCSVKVNDFMAVLHQELVAASSPSPTSSGRTLSFAFTAIEMPIAPILALSTHQGVSVDARVIMECVEKGEGRCKELERAGLKACLEGLGVESGSSNRTLAAGAVSPCGTLLRYSNAPAMKTLLYKVGVGEGGGLGLGVGKALGLLTSWVTARFRGRWRGGSGSGSGAAAAAAMTAMKGEGWPLNEAWREVGEESIGGAALEAIQAAARVIDKEWEERRRGGLSTGMSSKVRGGEEVREGAKEGMEKEREGTGGGRTPPLEDALARVRAAALLCSCLVEHRVLTSVVRAGKGVVASLPPLPPTPTLSTPSNPLPLPPHTLLLHPTFSTWTATGRISMVDPPLQSLPKTLVSPGLSLRHALLPTPGYTLLAADFAAAEARILAHLSGDTHMCTALNTKGAGAGAGGTTSSSAGQTHTHTHMHPPPATLHQKEGSGGGAVDFFKSVAGQWLGKGVGCVSESERGAAKRLVYGIVYGAGEGVLAGELGCSLAVARGHVAKFHARFPAIKAWISSCVKGGGESGGVVNTLGGRHRLLPALVPTTSSCSNSVSTSAAAAAAAAARQAVNTTCQGSVADIVKMGLARIFHAGGGLASSSSSSSFPSGAATSAGGEKALLRGPILQVHDELVWEVREGGEKEGGALVKALLEGVGVDLGLTVPLLAKVSVGKTWGDMVPLAL